MKCIARNPIWIVTTFLILSPIKTYAFNSSLDHTITSSYMDDDLVDTHNPLFIFMSIVYTISTLSAIITNLIVLLVYLLGQRAKTELSIFLINLAIADFLMSTVCMPFTFAQALLKRWIFGEIMCPIGKFNYSQIFKPVVHIILKLQLIYN